MNKAVFIDRDGTIVKDVHYCSRPEDLLFLPTVEIGLRKLCQSEFKIIIITNQSGVARGYFSEDMLKVIHNKFTQDIINVGGRIDAIYYCPHHPDEHCHCRKPETGMLKSAIKDWNLDPLQSYFIGDKYIDIEAANKIGSKAVLVPSEEPEISLLYKNGNYERKIDFISSNFIGAVKWVLCAAGNLMLSEKSIGG
jgi:histidinol-phosphate phosphatase family protein